MAYNIMDSNQNKPPTQNRQYLALQHTYLSLLNRQEPVSIHKIPIPFIANNIFGVKTNTHSISPYAADYLREVKQKPLVTQIDTQQPISEASADFDIGEKEENNDVVKLSLKGMKSLANVSSYLTSFMSKKK